MWSHEKQFPTSVAATSTAQIQSKMCLAFSSGWVLQWPCVPWKSCVPMAFSRHSNLWPWTHTEPGNGTFMN